ncbi:unnamed protein product [Ceratitis capitata]|uniref:(Mediterranean fruit fly) hypothetical protein n=1 Tax=Ceratitis capitata TaxID=7213 RepID=A0A811UV50_CERCA|nr:unnamed protein product [Ceratitis capitata]
MEAAITLLGRHGIRPLTLARPQTDAGWLSREHLVLFNIYYTCYYYDAYCFSHLFYTYLSLAAPVTNPVSTSKNFAAVGQSTDSYESKNIYFGHYANSELDVADASK